jgi:uncharacterized protein YcaQ
VEKSRRLVDFSIDVAGSAHQIQARRLWLRAQRLDEATPFSGGPEATRAAVEHLGYVQIDTINVIERCHHHILFTRIPDYGRQHLHQAQSVDKSVFEYWTNALSYVPVRDLRFFRRAMQTRWRERKVYFGTVSADDLRKVMLRIRRDGALSIRDIDDDVLVEKHHEWGSRKPSKRALQLAFFRGVLTINRRDGMLKTYELMERHFGWDKPPEAASEREITDYLIDRAIRAQGVISVDSICYLENAARKKAVRRAIEIRQKAGTLVPVVIDGVGKLEHWATQETLASPPSAPSELVHILSPFDPLVN